MIAKKIPVMQLVKFRHLPESRRATFANNLKNPKKPKSGGGGGNYWIRSVSGISNAFEFNNNTLIQEKIDDVTNVYDSTKFEGTKIMCKRNLEILHNYIDFDFSIWCPSTDLKFLDKHQITLMIKDIPIQVIPNHVFSYKEKEEQRIGGIWFVCWQDGFDSGDLGIFSEAFFKYLSFICPKEHIVDPNYCCVIDIQVFDLLEAPNNNTYFSVENHVTLSTINKAKGNEMGMVYVIGVDAVFVNKDYIIDRNKLFTAITRSKGWVNITGLGQAELCKNEMQRLGSNHYKLSFIQPSKRDTKTILRGMTEQQGFLNDVSKKIESYARNSGLSPDEILKILANQTKGKK